MKLFSGVSNTNNIPEINEMFKKLTDGKQTLDILVYLNHSLNLIKPYINDLQNNMSVFQSNPILINREMNQTNKNEL